MSVSSPLQEDRGSMDSPSTPFLDDKERLVNVDTAIKWIKDELVSVTIGNLTIVDIQILVTAHVCISTKIGICSM